MIKYHPALDGIRALSILPVLLCHGMVIPDSYGSLGVNTFFVLSGYLITSILLAEWDSRGEISLLQFYRRRALRLFPAMLTMVLGFLLCGALFCSGHQFKLMCRESVWTLVYLTNWAQIFHWENGLPLAHTWSLAIEEQFYLLWPAALILFLKRDQAKKQNSLPVWIGFGILLSVALRTAIFTGLDLAYNDPDRLPHGLDTRADALLVGCLASVLFNRQWSNVIGRTSLVERQLLRSPQSEDCFG